MKKSVSRRSVLAAGAAGMVLTNGVGRAFAQAAGKNINVAIIGAGVQGRILLRDALGIPGVRFVAACDIRKFSRDYAMGMIGKYNKRALGLPKEQQRPPVYDDFKALLADKKKLGLDAVVIATPDCWHAPITVAALEAGLHVYCEKEMAPTIEKSHGMVAAAKKSGKCCQIGHQRRSNPDYIETLKMIRETDLVGTIKTCYAQWNRRAGEKLTWTTPLPDADLKKWGFDSMDHFMNWRWFKKYSAGPIADLGSHQIDIFDWFLDAHAAELQANGTDDYYKDRAWHENVQCLYKYHTPKGDALAFYQVQNTNNFSNYFERFMGDKGTVIISEDRNSCYYVPQPGVQPPKWMMDADKVQTIAFDSAGNPSSILVDGYSLTSAFENKGGAAAEAMKLRSTNNVHKLHLMNFFASVAKDDPKLLNCPADIAYQTAVAVLSVQPALESGNKKKFTKADFHV